MSGFGQKGGRVLDEGYEFGWWLGCGVGLQCYLRIRKKHKVGGSGSKAQCGVWGLGRRGFGLTLQSVHTWFSDSKVHLLISSPQVA